MDSNVLAMVDGRRFASRLERAGIHRSPLWPRVRLAKLREQPACAATGIKTELEVHHIRPFHLHPELELDPSNLIVLTEHASFNAHFWIGHLGDWRSFNVDVIADAARLLEKIHGRPKFGGARD
jgi:5-methylcytosine-specific restriction protein A